MFLNLKVLLGLKSCFKNANRLALVGIVLHKTQIDVL
jgi:hypothetical protein